MDAAEVIKTIRDEYPLATCQFRELSLRDILAVLEDGEALAALGFTDEDQEAIEDAHASLTEQLKNRKDV